MEEKKENLPALETSVSMVQNKTDVNIFSDSKQFEHIQRVATMFSQSDLVPKEYKSKVGNCVIALEIANRMGASPLMIMQNLYVILGKPSWSSKVLIATLNSCGKFSPLRYEEDDIEEGRCRAWALDKINNEKIYGAWVSMEMAKAEGWLSKSGSKWLTMKQLMLRYRAASFFTNQFAPEVSMGLQTVEEVYDITPLQASATVIDKEKERMEFMIEDCKTVEEMELLQSMIEPNTQELFNKKLKSIQD